MKRREVLILLGAALGSAAPSLAQPLPRSARIGFLGLTNPTALRTRIDAFRAGLRDLGYVEGQNVVIEFRFVQGQYERLPDLSRLPPAIPQMVGFALLRLDRPPLGGPG